MPLPASATPDVDRAPPDAAFGRPFWFSYASNMSMMTAVSLLFVYADFVKSLGGDEWDIGWIVGVGMIGGIVMRFAQGVGIDLLGPRRIWLWSNAGYVGCCLAHLLIARADAPPIYLVRIVYQTSLAGVFGASITYVSGRAPVARMAEVIGTLGTSGFVGMMLGSALGRWIVGDGTPTRAQIDGLFIASASLGAAAFLFACIATQGHAVRRRTRRGPPLWWLLRRYNPGLILIVSAATGLGLNLPTVFLRPYMTQLGLVAGLMFFFNCYPPIAFVTRLSLRQVPDRVGIRPMIAVGIVSLVLGLLALVPVRATWHLLFPALFLGIAHATLFPAVVAGASGAFPGRWRGVGTTLVLAMFDVGTLLGSPLAGTLLKLSEHDGRPNYSIMLSTVGGVLVLCGICYFGFSKKSPRRRGA